MSNYLAIPNLTLGCLPLSILDSHLSAPPNDAQSFLGSQSPSGSPDCLPTALFVFNCDEARGRWSLQTDRAIISQKKYLYVSYCKANFPNIDKLEEIIKYACICLPLNAYWVDYACIGDQVDDKLETLHRMCGIIKGATKTLVLTGSEYTCPRTPQWLRWGRRLWTLPEVILSRYIVRFYLGKDYYTAGRSICKSFCQWETQDIETKLIYFYSEGHKNASNVITYIDLVEALINKIWRRHTDSESLTDLPEEKTYALMSIIVHQIDKVEGAELAFRTLIQKNNLPTERFPYPSEENLIYQENEAFNSFFVPFQFFFDTPSMFYPMKIKWRDDSSDRWVPAYSRQLDGQPYLAVSYRQEPGALYIVEQELQYLSWITFRYNAYWYDYCCMSGTEFPSCMDLYHMADVYLRAKATFIVLPDETIDGSDDRKLIWSEWGQCVWSLVETLLSPKIYYRIRGYNKVRSSRRDIFVNAYGADSRDMTLVDIAEGNVALSMEDVLAHLMDSIWRKSDTISGKILVSDHMTDDPGKLTLSYFKAEKVYALMMFMPVRIFPSIHETEYEALSRLLAANGIRSAVFRVWLSKWCNENIPGENHLCYLY